MIVKNFLTIFIINSIFKNYSEELEIVDGHPMEEDRADVSVDLRYHLKELDEFIGECDPRLIINCDESGLDSNRKLSSKKIIVVKSTTKKKDILKQNLIMAI